MGKIAIVTDSNSGITQEQGNELGIFVIPMPFFIDEELYLEGVNLTQEEFYTRQNGGADITTSQPNPAEICDRWKEILKTYDEIVHIPMSSGLSASCSTATAMAQDFDDKVQVVNNQRISVTMRQSVMDAITLANAGKTAKEIKEVLENEKFESSIYITLETLKYLKKGGRITPAAATLASVLNLKPVLQIQGERLDAYSKVRGKKAAKRAMIKAMKDDFENRFSKHIADGTMCLQISYCGNPDEAMEWKKEVEEAFPGFEVQSDPLSLSISCHIGQGALAIACAKKVTV